MKSNAEKSSASSSTASHVHRRPFIAPAVQRKMTLSKPGDKLEQDADRMADRVMREPSPAPAAEDKLQRQPEEKLQRERTPDESVDRKKDELQKAPAPEERIARAEEKLQKEAAPEEKLGRQADDKLRKAETPQEKLPRQEDKLQKASTPDEKLQKAAAGELQSKESDGTPSVGPGLQSAVKSAAAGGAPLSSETRGFMEPRFDADFSGVRVHNDSESANLGSQLAARAFTYQNHVFFSRDQYQPGTSEGKRLLAHELSHTMQQDGGLSRQGNPRPEEKWKDPQTIKRKAKAPAPAPAKEAITSSEVVDLSSSVFAPSEKVKAEIETQKHKGLEVRVIVKGLTGEGRVKVRVDSKKNFDSMGKGTMPLQNPWTDQIGGMHINFTIKNNAITGGYASLKPKGGDTNDWLQAIEKNSALLGGLGLKVEKLPKPVNKFEGGTLTLGVTNLRIEIGGVVDANLNIALENVGTPKIDATADVNVKGVVKGQLKLDNAKGPLAGQVSLAVEYKSFAGAAVITYNPDGSIDVGGKAAYNADKLSGEISFVATDLETANKFAKDAIAAAGGRENVQDAPPPGPVPAPKPGKKERALAATGLLAFHLTDWFAGTVNVVVDGKGQITVIGKIAPPAEILLFHEKNFDREIVKLEAKAYYGIPVIGNLNLFANASLIALARFGPAKIYNIEILGTYSTDPEIQKSIQISGSINISAYAGLRLRAEGGAGIEIASHDLKFGVGIQADIGVKAYADARPTVGWRDPGVFYVSGTVDLVAQPMFGLGGDFFIALETPWWSPLSDDRWTWPLFSKEWPLSDPIGISAVVKEYVLGSGKTPEIELKKPEFDPSKFMTSMVDKEIPDKSGGKDKSSGTFKDDGTVPPPVVPPKKPAPKKGEPLPPKKGAPPKGGKSAKPDPKGPKELETGKMLQAAAKPLSALKAKGPFDRSTLNKELEQIKATVKGISFGVQAKGENWVVTPKAGGKSGKGIELKGKDVAKDAAKNGKADERTEAQKQRDLDSALAEANKLLDDEEKDAPEVQKALPAIKTKFRLTSIELVETPADEDEVYDSIKASINPKKKGPQKKRLKKHKSDYVIRKGHQYVLDPKYGYDTKQFIRDSFYGKGYRKYVYDWRDGLVNDPNELRHPTKKNLYWWKNRYWDKNKEYDEAPTVDHKKTAVVDHWNDEGRTTYQKARKDYFNDISGKKCEVVPFSQNSSMGAKLTGSYKKTVTIKFRGPGEGRS
ncbi:MAG TPA: hypothetical protein DCZ75_19130 [Geobacter sp.]|nr:hypothetical protein [Geobacter sp.]